MKEVTTWNNTPRMMWVWDYNEEKKSKAKGSLY